MSNKKRTQVDDIDRGVYDIKNEFKYRSKTEKGLTEDIVKQISLEKDEPEWMLEKRLEALEIFNSKDDPVWGPDLSTVNIDDEYIDLVRDTIEEIQNTKTIKLIRVS